MSIFPTVQHLATSYQIVDTLMDDPLVQPMLADLAREYSARYHKSLTTAEIENELVQYPSSEFASPDGAFILLVDQGQAIAGGALRRRVEPEIGKTARGGRFGRDSNGLPTVPTGELKRIWTHWNYRRMGLAQIVVDELERRAQELGYQRIYLTTGPKQPEAEGLYLGAGYIPLYEISSNYTEPLPFEKWLNTNTDLGQRHDRY